MQANAATREVLRMGREILGRNDCGCRPGPHSATAARLARWAEKGCATRALATRPPKGSSRALPAPGGPRRLWRDGGRQVQRDPQRARRSHRPHTLEQDASPVNSPLPRAAPASSAAGGAGDDPAAELSAVELE